MENFNLVAGLASIIGLVVTIIGGKAIYKKYRINNSLKGNTQIINGGNGNYQAGRDIKNVK